MQYLVTTSQSLRLFIIKIFFYIAQVSPPHWPLDCWDCGFESCRGHGCLSLVIVAVFCQVAISAWSGTLVQKSPTECGVPECDRAASIMRWPWSTTGCFAMGGGDGSGRYALFIVTYDNTKIH